LCLVHKPTFSKVAACLHDVNELRSGKNFRETGCKGRHSFLTSKFFCKYFLLFFEENLKSPSQASVEAIFVPKNFSKILNFGLKIPEKGSKITFSL
ncbi:MAG: hypothetical protein IKZ50_05505, partial [Bacteroidales bacterium]|nr:hypothetical protein [Bacteroidales bacterium]